MVRARARDVEGDGVLVVDIRQSVNEVRFAGTEVGIVSGVHGDRGRLGDLQEGGQDEYDRADDSVFHWLCLGFLETAGDPKQSKRNFNTFLHRRSFSRSAPDYCGRPLATNL